MRHALMIAAALALTAGASTTANAQRIDLDGRCRAADGSLIKTEACKPPKAEPNGAHHLYMRDAQGACRDEKGKVANPAFCKR